MAPEKLTLPVGGRLRKSGSAKNLSGSTKNANQPTIKQPPPGTNRSQLSNSSSVRKGKLITLDGRLLSSTDSKEVSVRSLI